MTENPADKKIETTWKRVLYDGIGASKDWVLPRWASPNKDLCLGLVIHGNEVFQILRKLGLEAP